MGDVPQGGGAASPQPGLTALVTDAAGFIDHLRVPDDPRARAADLRARIAELT
jgi:hypothetical protein